LPPKPGVTVNNDGWVLRNSW
jgi:hypothetical protein